MNNNNNLDVYSLFIDKLKNCESVVPLSKKSGVPVTTIYSWRSGAAIPTIISMQKVLNAMGLELSINNKK